MTENQEVWPPPPSVQPPLPPPDPAYPPQRLPWWGFAGFLMSCLAVSGACKFRTAYALVPMQPLVVPPHRRSLALEGTTRTVLLGLVLSAAGMMFSRQMSRSWKPAKLFHRFGISGVIFAACVLLGLVAVLLVVTA